MEAGALFSTLRSPWEVPEQLVSLKAGLPMAWQANKISLLQLTLWCRVRGENPNRGGKISCGPQTTQTTTVSHRLETLALGQNPE